MERFSGTYENYKIHISYEDNVITFNIENTRVERCYRLIIPHELYMKKYFPHDSNISNMKSVFHFCQRCVEKKEGYQIHIFETPIYVDLKLDHHELILKFQGSVDGYYDLFFHLQMNEHVLTFEERMEKMMAKMACVYEEKIDILEKEVDELRSMLRKRKSSSIDLCEVEKEKENIQIQCEKIPLECVEKELGENDKNFFYRAWLSSSKKSVVMSRKEFVYEYDVIFSNLPQYEGLYAEFLNDPHEELCEVRYEGGYEIYKTNKGRIFAISPENAYIE